MPLKRRPKIGDRVKMGREVWPWRLDEFYADQRTAAVSQRCGKDAVTGEEIREKRNVVVESLWWHAGLRLWRTDKSGGFDQVRRKVAENLSKLEVP